MPDSDNLLTSQEIALLEYVRQAMPIDQAIRMAGMDFDVAAKFLATDNRGSQAVEFSKTLSSVTFNITKDLITSQMYQAMARSASTAEDMMCLKEIAKIHGLYETKVRVVKAGVEEETEGQKSLKKIQRMDDADLLLELETVGISMDLLPQKIERAKPESIEEGVFTDDC